MNLRNISIEDLINNTGFKSLALPKGLQELKLQFSTLKAKNIEIGFDSNPEFWQNVTELNLWNQHGDKDSFLTIFLADPGIFTRLNALYYRDSLSLSTNFESLNRMSHFPSLSSLSLNLHKFDTSLFSHLILPPKLTTFSLRISCFSLNEVSDIFESKTVFFTNLSNYRIT
jgi:hypothetical protein